MLSAESRPSSKGANRQIAPSPVGWEGRSPVIRGFGAQPREKKIDDFLSIFGKDVLVLKDRIHGNTEF